MTRFVERMNEVERDLSYAYVRPKDASTLMLVDRSGPVPKVLLGKRHQRHKFMPGRYVFPGGRVDPADRLMPVARPLDPHAEAHLMKRLQRASPVKARAFALAAIRETFEETGLLLGAAVSERRGIERQLRDKQEKLDRSLRLAAASELASALAHELNQPLSAITAYVRACEMMLANAKADSAEIKATMDKVIGEANRAGSVVRRLRDFFRSGTVQIENVAPSVLVDEACATIR